LRRLWLAKLLPAVCCCGHRPWCWLSHVLSASRVHPER